ncbi:type IV pilus modification protein PilV [Alcanivorax sp. S6407]|uniref:type IV pilus modification protein PilV n=1 Tax=Alcanivorax sp. S6407 TaxID=2926424 RepID=UPI001FF4A002|nr:type IV pilus modification protein PilV [Alcanivorax sp. S6407]MCK0155221.1 type IV pilus modification protein PilV [Alcanivorax sp. S6407]
MKRESMRGHQSGMGMMEVLVALLVLSVGVLGYAGLQLRALDSTDETYMRSQAMAVAQDAVERMMANPGASAVYETEGNWGGAAAANLPQTCLGQNCTAAQIAAWDIAQLTWYANDLLSQGVVGVEDCATGTSQCVLVAWGGESLDNCQDAGGAASGVDCVVLEVRL